jgi:hypothetical protein
LHGLDQRHDQVFPRRLRLRRAALPADPSRTRSMDIGQLSMRGVAIPPFYAGQIGAQAAER